MRASMIKCDKMMLVTQARLTDWFAQQIYLMASKFEAVE